MPTNVPSEPSDARCLVCGKSVEHGGGFSRFKVGEAMIALCCPLCFDTFHADRGRFEAKLQAWSAGLLDDHRFTP